MPNEYIILHFISQTAVPADSIVYLGGSASDTGSPLPSAIAPLPSLPGYTSPLSSVLASRTKQPPSATKDAKTMDSGTNGWSLSLTNLSYRLLEVTIPSSPLSSPHWNFATFHTLVDVKCAATLSLHVLVGNTVDFKKPVAEPFPVPKPEEPALQVRTDGRTVHLLPIYTHADVISCVQILVCEPRNQRMQWRAAFATVTSTAVPSPLSSSLQSMQHHLPIPAARVGHAACAVKSRIFVFGGAGLKSMVPGRGSGRSGEGRGEG
jgi:hypothetical protein